MFYFLKYREYLILSCLTIIFAVTPTVAKATFQNKSEQTMPIADSRPANNTTLTEEAQIKQSILLAEQKNHWQPQVNVLAITGNYAVASVHDENTGGQSVLRKEGGKWKVICGTGGAFGKAEEIVQLCKVPLPTARRLLQLQTPERSTNNPVN